MKSSFSVQSFIIGLIFGALIVSAWYYGSSMPVKTVAATATSTPATTGVASSTAATGTGTNTTSSPEVSVSTQAAGNSVNVESVTVPPPGVWVAVREVNGGSLGNILGAALAGGPRSNVTVPLLRNTLPDRMYAVELYRPNGTSTTFNLKKDSVYVSLATSKPVIVYFNTIK